MGSHTRNILVGPCGQLRTATQEFLALGLKNSNALGYCVRWIGGTADQTHSISFPPCSVYQLPRRDNRDVYFPCSRCVLQLSSHPVTGLLGAHNLSHSRFIQQVKAENVHITATTVLTCNAIRTAVETTTASLSTIRARARIVSFSLCHACYSSHLATSSKLSVRANSSS